MTRQLDMFAAAAPTFAPHLDPELVANVVCMPETDRDHIGENDVGRLGNNRQVWCAVTYDRNRTVLACETFGDSVCDGPAEGRAKRYAETLRLRIAANRQQLLSL